MPGDFCNRRQRSRFVSSMRIASSTDGSFACIAGCEDISSLLQDADVEERRALTVRYHLGQPVDLGRTERPGDPPYRAGGTLVSNVAQDMYGPVSRIDSTGWNGISWERETNAITENSIGCSRRSGLNR